MKAGQKVLDARALYPERFLAEHYNPLAMDPALVKAHDALDREVDKAFGASKKLTTERQRKELLFSNFAAPPQATKPRRKSEGDEPLGPSPRTARSS